MVVWNAEADAKLLAAIFNDCGITLFQDQYKKLADVMGCTPKAIMHRMTKIRKGTAWPAGAGEGTAKKAGGGKKAVVNEQAGLTTPPPSSKGAKKRVQSEEDEEDEGNLLCKKVKIEVGEDIGAGLRALKNGGESGDDVG